MIALISRFLYDHWNDGKLWRLLDNIWYRLVHNHPDYIAFAQEVVSKAMFEVTPADSCRI